MGHRKWHQLTWTLRAIVTLQGIKEYKLKLKEVNFRLHKPGVNSATHHILTSVQNSSITITDVNIIWISSSSMAQKLSTSHSIHTIYNWSSPFLVLPLSLASEYSLVFFSNIEWYGLLCLNTDTAEGHWNSLEIPFLTLFGPQGQPHSTITISGAPLLLGQQS